MSEAFTIIHTYSRSQAIEDGVLVDVTDLAREAGFRVPVAVTASVWARYVEVPTGASGQDETGRLWDVISMLRFAIATNRDQASELRFRLYVVLRAGADPELVELKAMCGPDDDGSPCITVMMPDED
ncbi:MAG: hypothetical protein GC190_20070 [Alphaproteobacteria bacterium]|nr:hypothetical protein [Alphaproteobacteria bacterium]